MKWSTRLFLLAAMMCSFILLPSVPFVALIDQWLALSPTQQPGTLALQAPALFKTAHAQAAPDFLASEAGISAYVNIEKPINFALLNKMMKGNILVEEETAQYITAITKPAGYENYPELEEYANINLYIHVDGWIIAYLPKQVPAAMMIDFVNYEQQKMNSTTLSNIITTIASALKIDSVQINYYDFSHPEATNLQLITDVERSDKFYEESDDFHIEVPSSLAVLETSWIHVAYNIEKSHFLLDDIELSNFFKCDKCWRIQYGYLGNTELLADTDHKFVLYNHQLYSDTRDNGTSRTQVGLAIFYRRSP